MSEPIKFSVRELLTSTLITLVCAAFTGGMTGLDMGVNAERKVAIAAGVARYTVNPSTGETKFEYITPTK